MMALCSNLFTIVFDMLSFKICCTAVLQLFEVKFHSVIFNKALFVAILVWLKEMALINLISILHYRARFAFLRIQVGRPNRHLKLNTTVITRCATVLGKQILLSLVIT